MFRKVLVATDFSAHADRTLDCIGEIPGMEEIVLVHVIDKEQAAGSPSFLNRSNIPPAQKAAETLDEKKRTLEQQTGLPVRALLVTGEDGDKAGPLIRAAKEENVSLIVMGGRGRSPFFGRILGSVTEAAIRRGRIDVLVMHFKGMEKADPGTQEKFCRNVFSHVLCPVDFSKPSLNTVEYLNRLAPVRAVTLLHVLENSGTTAQRELKARETEERLRNMAAEMCSPRITVTSLVRTGNPADEICKTAEERDVSVIVLARFGASDYIKNIPLGSVASGVITRATRPLFILSPHISLNVTSRELSPAEFPLAEGIWLSYHQQKADPATDRIFGVFVEGTLAGVARCKQHVDGFEVDGVFVPEDFRGSGYARRVMQALIEKCGSATLSMHATLDLVEFYSGFGFRIIGEPELPRTIRDRFIFAEGDMKGLHVQPMRRDPT